MTTPQNTADTGCICGAGNTAPTTWHHSQCPISATGSADYTAPTIENYRRLARQGAGPAAAALFAALTAADQATIREENLRARGIIDHGSRFD